MCKNEGVCLYIRILLKSFPLEPGNEVNDDMDDNN